MSTITETQTLPQGTWAVDKVHSDIAFAVDYMIGTFKGKNDLSPACVMACRWAASAACSSSMAIRSGSRCPLLVRSACDLPWIVTVERRNPITSAKHINSPSLLAVE